MTLTPEAPGLAGRAPSSRRAGSSPRRHRVKLAIRARLLAWSAALLLALSSAVSLLPPAALAAGPVAFSFPIGAFTPPAVSAPAWAVAINGQMVAGSEETTPMATASTAKVMTAYVILTQHVIPLTGSITITAADVAQYRAGVRADDWMMPVKVGEHFTNLELLNALLVRSYDNTATLLAQQAPGGLGGFVRLMNRTAQSLGLTEAHFADPSGLSPLDRVSPLDMTKLAVAALANPTFRQIVAEKTITLPYQPTVPNIDRLLTKDPAAIGVKTGWTTAAGHTMVFAGQETVGGQLVTVVGTIDRVASYALLYQDAEALLQAGFTAAGQVYPLTTRLAFVTALAQALNLAPVDAPAPAFSDLPATSPGYGYAEAAYQAGWLKGVAPGLLDPTGLINRAEAAKMEVMALGQTPLADSLYLDRSQFKDSAQIPAWALGYVNAAARLGLYRGYRDGTFQPALALDQSVLKAAISQFETVATRVQALSSAAAPPSP